MSLAEGVPPFLPPTDPERHEDRKRGARSGHIRRSAIVVSALVHAAIVLALLARLPAFFSVAPPPPQPIRMILMKAPPPPPRAKPSRPPPSAPPHELVSGSGDRTTAPPQAIRHDAETAHKPAEAAPPAAKPRPAPTSHRPTSRHARRESAPHPEHQGDSANPALGATEQEGDPYLNRLSDLIERHRTYPANAVGLGLKGIGIYRLTIATNGTLMGVKIVHSTGASILDRAAIKMIEAAAPFPPLPAYFRYGPFAVITATISIYPPGTG